MGSIVKKITKPISKVLDKVIPNEIKPALPYLAAVAPYLAPATFAAGAAGLGSFSGLGSMASRAALSGALNLGAQLSQEGSEGEFNPYTLALAAGSGALTDPTAGATIRGKTFASQMGDTGATRNLFQKGVDVGLEGLAKTADVMSAGAAPGATLGAKLTAAAAPVGIETSKSAYDAALAAQKSYEQQLADYYKQTGELLEDNSSARISAITSSMLNAGFSQTDIDDALRQIGLLSVGGRVGLFGGGILIKEEVKEDDDSLLAAAKKKAKKEGIPINKALQMLMEKNFEQDVVVQDKAEGGIMNLGGKEMDMRGGGFIPIGAKEKADDVPARLSKNEFVMTADAVRGMGNGDVDKGAKRMYDIMNKYEVIGRA